MILGTETERKFLVRDGWPRDAPGHYIRQGYLPSAPGITLRVRWTEKLGTITVKTPVFAGTRWEAECSIPPDTAAQLLTTCPNRPVEKVRHVWIVGDLSWEIDEFKGRHTGLVVAEVELLHPWQDIVLPTWVGEEVTHVRAFHNSVITKTESFHDVLALWRQALIKENKHIKCRNALDVQSIDERYQRMLGMLESHSHNNGPL
ncbi:hypothetical protein A6A04_17015 [Paramagnetospirillum marisnigri]|uniref:CYTH domain-containing protein n=2 Tax=Paramagnetospirillum marisnigri TaxID=1285242 RepID=A0A178MPR0_9PROT|nr:hypothetical protein A6A04_17015 [Paramagnetospirillum marisnigri]